jgi:hypothetical protein
MIVYVYVYVHVHVHVHVYVYNNMHIIINHNTVAWCFNGWISNY